MKDKLTCIITDDEPFARKGLIGYAEKTSFLELVGVCEDGIQLSDMLREKKPDILFLDIEMPHITGVELLRSLPDPPKVIFTTAYEQYAIQGYELDVLDYLLKPISYERFLKSAYKALDYFTARRNASTTTVNYLFVKAEGRLEKIVFDELLYIQGMENYLSLYTTTRKIIVHSTLKAFLEKLPAGKFIQVHKSYVVATDKINTIDGNLLHVGKDCVPVGRSVREWVLEQIVKSHQ
ncbi:MAG: ypdB 4 [Mucilaginibacter sp.]|nr:ypdB 4 [Mucilaginibacter sp.]